MLVWPRGKSEEHTFPHFFLCVFSVVLPDWWVSPLWLRPLVWREAERDSGAQRVGTGIKVGSKSKISWFSCSMDSSMSVVNDAKSSSSQDDVCVLLRDCTLCITCMFCVPSLSTGPLCTASLLLVPRLGAPGASRGGGLSFLTLLTLCTPSAARSFSVMTLTCCSWTQDCVKYSVWVPGRLSEESEQMLLELGRSTAEAASPSISPSSSNISVSLSPDKASPLTNSDSETPPSPLAASSAMTSKRGWAISKSSPVTSFRIWALFSHTGPLLCPAPVRPCEVTDRPESLLADGVRSLQFGLLVVKENKTPSSLLFFLTLAYKQALPGSRTWGGAVDTKSVWSE